MTSTSATPARLLTLFGDLSPDDHVQIVTPVLFIEQGSVLGVDGEVVDVRSGLHGACGQVVAAPRTSA